MMTKQETKEALETLINFIKQYNQMLDKIDENAMRRRSESIHE